MAQTRNNATGALCAIILVLVILGTATIATVRENKPKPKRATFKAAVFEYAAVFPFPPNDTISRDEALAIMNTNLDAYEIQAKIAGKQGVDILVFPEIALYGFGFTRAGAAPFTEHIPDPKAVFWNPCMEPKPEYAPHDVQTRLSCMARNNNLYLTANMADGAPCSKMTTPMHEHDEQTQTCPANGQHQFNTNVVYNPDGILIAKYHKRRLYMEPGFDFANPAEEVFFDTPFGRIGTFICFDIMFKDPAINVVEKYNIDTILYPTAWLESEALPIFQPLGIHSAFARRIGVNLLSANLQMRTPATCSGSGIYAPNGTVTFYREEWKQENKLVISTIESSPKFAPLNSAEVIIPKSEGEFTSHVGKTNADLYNFVKISGNAGAVSVCQGAICCQAVYMISNLDSEDLYALGAFDGLHKNSIWYMQTCALLKCADKNDKSTCGKVITSTSTSTRFDFLHLSGKFESNYVFPYVIIGDGENMGLPAELWHFNGNSIKASNGFSKPVITAVIYARPHDKDVVWNGQHIKID